MNKLSIIFIFLSWVLVGCSIFSPKKMPSSGYAITRMSQQTYIISYDGIGYASKVQVDHYLFIRAAMLAKEGGYNYFSVTDSEIIPRVKYAANYYRKTKPPYCKAIIVQLVPTDARVNQSLYSVNSILGLI